MSSVTRLKTMCNPYDALVWIQGYASVRKEGDSLFLSVQQQVPN